MSIRNLNAEVTAFLDKMNHPLRAEIEYLRNTILNVDAGLVEGIKWNGPNYSFNGEDRITIRISPPKQLQIVLHRGAKVKEQPEGKILTGTYDNLVWKQNDRAIVSFKTMEEIQKKHPMLEEIVAKWIEATK